MNSGNKIVEAKSFQLQNVDQLKIKPDSFTERDLNKLI